jgi:hypothetical protein
VDKCRVGRSVLAAVGAVLIAPTGATNTALVVNTCAVTTALMVPTATVNTALVVPVAAVPAGRCRVGRSTWTSVG